MLTITPATERDLVPAARILAEAFADDPLTRAILPRADRRLDRVADLYLGVLRSGPFPAGVVDLARREGDPRIVGVAGWDAPGSTRGELARQARVLPLFRRALGLAGIPRALRVLHRVGRLRPAAPHWYLSEIGVGSSARGLGAGSALLRHRLQAIDRARDDAYLEASTPSSRRLYARFGFRDLGPVRGVAGTDATAMIRAPQRP